MPDGDYVKFMEQYTGKHYPAGDFLDLDGKPVGKAQGCCPLCKSARDAASVLRWESRCRLRQDMEKNTVSVGPEAALFSDTVIVDDELDFDTGASRFIKAKIHYRHAEQPVTVSPMEDGRVNWCLMSRSAATIGQAAVLYDGDVVVGGGTIVDMPNRRGK